MTISERIMRIVNGITAWPDPSTEQLLDANDLRKIAQEVEELAARMRQARDQHEWPDGVMTATVEIWNAVADALAPEARKEPSDGG